MLTMTVQTFHPVAQWISEQNNPYNTTADHVFDRIRVYIAFNFVVHMKIFKQLECILSFKVRPPDLSYTHNVLF